MRDSKSPSTSVGLASRLREEAARVRRFSAVGLVSITPANADALAELVEAVKRNRNLQGRYIEHGAEVLAHADADFDAALSALEGNGSE